jgi:hypothetical protein
MIYSHQSVYINPPLIDESRSSLRQKPFNPSHIFKNDGKSNCSQNRHVTFFEQVAFRETIHLNQYTADERQKSWYNRRELKEIKCQLKKTAVSMQVGQLKIDTDFDCTRGLEFRVGKKAILRRRRISHALMAVLSEQEDQMMLGIHDPVTISLAYRFISRVSSAKAHEVGLRDEFEAYCKSYSGIGISEERKIRSKSFVER